MYTRCRLRLAIRIVIRTAKGAKANLPMPPKAYLVLRRYAYRALVQGSPQGRGRHHTSRAILIRLGRFLADPSGRPPLLGVYALLPLASVPFGSLLRVQVTHFPAALRTGMPGRKLCKHDSRSVIFSAPRPLFFSGCGSKLQSPPAGLSCLGPAFRKAFRSLTAASRFQVAAARSKLPAYFFNATLELSSSPFDPLLLRSTRLFRFGRDHRNEPVA